MVLVPRDVRHLHQVLFQLRLYFLRAGRVQLLLYRPLKGAFYRNDPRPVCIVYGGLRAACLVSWG